MEATTCSVTIYGNVNTILTMDVSNETKIVTSIYLKKVNTVEYNTIELKERINYYILSKMNVALCFGAMQWQKGLY